MDGPYYRVAARSAIVMLSNESFAPDRPPLADSVKSPQCRFSSSHLPIALTPDPSRMITRLFFPGDIKRAREIVERALRSRGRDRTTRQ